MRFSPNFRAIFRHQNLQSAAGPLVFNNLTSKCASGHSGVQFFDIRTSKSAPNLTCLVHFDFKMPFSPQWRAIFRHQNCKKCSEPDVFLHFDFLMRFSTQQRAIFRHQNFKKCSPALSFLTIWLQKALLAKAACNSSTSELQKVLQTWRVFCILTSKCAFRHSGVQFLISPLTTWLRARRFNRPTFRLTRHTKHWKNKAFRDFSNIWRGCIFFLLSFALLHLLSADLTTLLCFSTVHIV